MERITDLMALLEATNDPTSLREQARDLVHEVLAWHKEGIARLSGAMDPGTLAEAARDPLVAALFDLHGIEAPPPAKLVPASALRKRAPAPPDPAVHTCELCAAPARGAHTHLLDVAAGMLVCACDTCAANFVATPNATSRFARVPDTVKRVDDLGASDAWWKTIGVPSGVAFFVVRGAGEAVRVFYPGPAGATEASLPRETWDAAASRHPSLAAMLPHVQALVVDRADSAREHWICGVDRAYELVARVRAPWQGLTGGDGVRDARRRFFADLGRGT